MHYNLILKRLDNKWPNFLDLAEVKKYLRVDFDEDDEVLTNLAIAVCEKAENFMSINLLERSVKQVIFNCLVPTVKLYHEPVIEVETIAIENKLISVEEWNFNSTNNSIDFICEVPREFNITINYISGFTKHNVSSAIKVGLLEHIAFLYDGQESSYAIPPKVIEFYLPLRSSKIWR